MTDSYPVQIKLMKLQLIQTRTELVFHVIDSLFFQDKMQYGENWHETPGSRIIRNLNQVYVMQLGRLWSQMFEEDNYLL